MSRKRNDQLAAARNRPSHESIFRLLRARVRRPCRLRLLTTQCRCATIVAMAAQPIRYVRDHISELVNDVELHHERIEVTRNGRVVAVLVSAEEMSALEETLSVLSDPAALADIREADLAYAAGDVVVGTDAVRALRP